MMEMANLLMKVIKVNPGVLQKDMKKLIGEDDGRKVARVLHYMEIYRKIRKEKKGKNNQLFVVQKDGI